MNRTVSAFVFGVLVGCLVAAAAVAWLGKPSSQITDGSSVVRTLRVGHGLPKTHPVHAGIVRFADLVKEYSGGKIVVEVFPDSLLGDETQMLEQIQRGTLDLMKTSTAPLGNFISVAKVFSLPYLFRDEKHFWSTLDGPIGEEFMEDLRTLDNGQPSGFRGLAFYDAGSRNFYANKPIRSPADLAGMKIRVLPDPIAMDMVTALGGSPTPLSSGELYTALKQGVVDGAENNPPFFVSGRHFEVSKYFTFDHHMRIPDILLVNSNLWDSFTPRERDWIQRAARESSLFQRKAWETASDEAVEVMKAQGVTIYEADPTEFARVTKSVIENDVTPPMRELARRIQSVED